MKAQQLFLPRSLNSPLLALYQLGTVFLGVSWFFQYPKMPWATGGAGQGSLVAGPKGSAPGSEKKFDHFIEKNP